MFSLINFTNKTQRLKHKFHFWSYWLFFFTRPRPNGGGRGIRTTTTSSSCIPPWTKELNRLVNVLGLLGSGNHPFSGNYLCPVLNITVLLCLCIDVQKSFSAVNACQGGGQCEYVVYFYYVASHFVVYTWTLHLCNFCVCLCVREVGAAERYHKLVGHSSAANQKSKQLWVSPLWANLWPRY